MNNYELGVEITLMAVFSDDEGLPITPEDLRLIILAPDGEQQTITNLVDEGAGVFSYDITPTQSGRHWYRFLGAGVAKENVFFVDHPVVIEIIEEPEV